MPVLSTLYPTAFVTGASAGIGRACAEMLLAEGVRVWGTARVPDRLAPLAPHPGFTAVALDLENPLEAEAAMLRAAAAAGGRFDLMINNAGYGLFAPFVATEFPVWQRQIEAMLTSTLRLAHAALRGMQAQQRGCLVNVASLATEFPLPYMTGYNVVKAALSAFSESLLVETRNSGITIIDFRPGDYRTSFNQAMQTHAAAPAAVADAQCARVWQQLEANLLAAPPPARAAADLRRALLARRRGIVRSGSFFQAGVAPLLARFAPSGLRRAVMWRYFGAC
ncbi:MAG TPA: SDR family NAD(P)-dependent oxidoreductase [Opitutaceae bacterium]